MTVCVFARATDGTLMWRVLDVYESAQEYPWDAVLERDFGEVKGLGRETAPGVFVREYTNGTVALDCSSFTATFD